MMMENQLLDLLALSHVPRWTIIATSRQQSVAEHSYRVAVIAQFLVDYIKNINDRDGMTLLRWAIMHDGPEAITGDVPTPFKRMLNEAGYDIHEAKACSWYTFEKGTVSAIKKSIVSLADTIEAISFISKWGVGGTAERITNEMKKRLILEAEAFEEEYDTDGIVRTVNYLINHVLEES